MDKRRGEIREKIKRIEAREGIRDQRGRMEELRRVEREKKQIIESREGRRERGRMEELIRGQGRDIRERMEDWRNHGREDRHSRGHMSDKRERPDELIDHRREKRPRSDVETEDRERRRAEFDNVKRREERQKIESRGHMREKRERPDELRDHRREKRQRSDGETDDREKRRYESHHVKRRGDQRIEIRDGLTPRERLTSLSALNQISGRLSADKEENKEKRLCQVFEHLDNVKGKRVNILAGLELHTDVFNPTEQAIITDFVFGMQRLGQQKQLKRFCSSFFA
ncbi:Oxidoreductase, 2OG-Fe(II) oxygenase family protein [Carex littledalei]|uniref:Oxidoreductase, 2OG-Fe(II) oxygenase family protein n=1 Tax=Carex littledalei TaxID=544730 RepID=A0A833QZH5_9POAL|nr:Oxidoreductase, 2OG-Fe(II) oxygenase family protein [Carex littledalei]